MTITLTCNRCKGKGKITVEGTIGEKLKALRENANIELKVVESQTDLTDLHLIEKGNKELSLKQAFVLAGYFGIDVNELRDDSDYQVPKFGKEAIEKLKESNIDIQAKNFRKNAMRHGGGLLR